MLEWEVRIVRYGSKTTKRSAVMKCSDFSKTDHIGKK